MFKSIAETAKYRSLVWALVKRHLAARYRGSVLGFLWSFLNPLCLMLVYLLVFRHYARFDAGQNYTIFVFSGLLPWLWFSTSLIEGTVSIVGSGHLITKSMFPAQILPLVAVITNLINFLLSLPLMFLFMFLFGVTFHLTLLLVPFVLLLQFIMIYGVVLALGALNVYFRDVQHILGNLLTLLFFLCPIVYPANSVPDRFKFTMEYNPVALLTNIYHQLMLDGVLPSILSIAIVVIFSIISYLFGSLVFDRHREGFAELL